VPASEQSPINDERKSMSLVPDLRVATLLQVDPKREKKFILHSIFLDTEFS